MDEMDDFLEDLGLKHDDANFHTVAELMVLWKISGKDKLRGYLNKLKAVGRLEVKQVCRTSLDDKSIQVPAYKILPRKGKNRTKK
jgi:hypothetical protein